MTLTLLDLAGTVALLLWGIHMVQTGVQRAFGAQLRGILNRALRNRLQAFATGLGVTTILQSSTATGLMVTGFAMGGLVDLVPALAVMLGANVGSALIAQALSFDVAVVAPLFVLVGVVLFRRASAGRRDFGRVLIGLGLVLMALRQFLSLLGQFHGSEGLASISRELQDQPVLLFAIGVVVTWAFHSSVASVLIVMSLAAQGLLSIEPALALVLGANVGSAINPVVEGGGTADPEARRLPVGNLLIRSAGAVAALALLGRLGPLAQFIGSDTSHQIVNFHTLFNIALAIVFLPLLTPYARLLKRLLPSTPMESDPTKPHYLDPSARSTPVVALGGAAREALRLADFLEAMLQGLRDTLESSDRRRISEIRRLDDIVDSINSAIKAYVTTLDHEALSDADHRRLNDILTFAMNFEQAADVVDNNLLALVAKAIKRGVTFSNEGKAELIEMIDRLIVNTRTAASLFVNDDVRAARLMARQKEEFRRLEANAVTQHFQRLRSGLKDSVETSAMHLDAVRDLKQINAHLVAAAAYPVLASNDELLHTRVRNDDQF